MDMDKRKARKMEPTSSNSSQTWLRFKQRVHTMKLNFDETYGEMEQRTC